jgi:hypothetical protein
MAFQAEFVGVGVGGVFGAAESFGFVFDEQAGDEVFGVFRDFYACGELQLGLLDFFEDGVLVGVGKWGLADVHLVDYAAQGPEVGLEVADAVFQDLWGHVVWGADEGGTPLTIFLDVLLFTHLFNGDDFFISFLPEEIHRSIRTPKIRKLEMPIPRAQHIRSLLYPPPSYLKVPMHHLTLLQILQHRHHLRHIVPHRQLRQFTR